MSPLNEENFIGTLIKERYQVESSLGSGSMGVVYRARDTLLRRDVAIKVVSHFSLEMGSRDRLLQEAQSIAQLNHPHIVTVFDVGELDGFPFIVMELVDGFSLHETNLGNLKKIIAVAIQICVALQHAHAQGVIHRDIKPENILLDKEGNAKLMDFGIARSVASRLTEQGALLGTIHYMAPEQALGGEIDQRADLYSLGALLYELVCGRLPFEAEDPLAVITQLLHAPLVPPRAFNEDLPLELDSLIVHLLAKEPEDRPGSASEVLEVLERILTTEDSKLELATRFEKRELSVLDRIMTGRMVGRQRDLAEARFLWQEAMAGKGQLLLISGEPGIGKTRLVQELITQAKINRARVFLGASYAEWEPPYAPFRQIIRTEAAEFRSEIPDEVLEHLATIAPEIRTEFPGLPDNPADDPQAEGGRLANSLLALFNLISKNAPVLLVVEDVHWADDSTLRLIRHLARNIRHARMLIVITYREVELQEAQLLHEVLLDFTREKLGRRVKLNRLNRQGTNDLLEILFDEEITPEFLDGIFMETEGNPFFIEEVCKALVESGKLFYQDGRWHRPSMDELGIPQSIQVAIQSRVRALPGESFEVLEQAAVLGREFDIKTLKYATGKDENTLIDALDDAISARLILEINPKSEEIFAFNHALIPGALIEGMRTLHRRRLHLRAALALQAFHPESFEALAYQFIEAGDVGNGVEYLVQAGDRARMQYAYSDAIRNFHQACEHLRDQGQLEEVARIMMKLGLTYHNDFQYEGSRQAYQEGFNLWQQAGKLKKGEQLPPAPHALRAFGGEPLSLDPNFNTDGWSSNIIDNIFSGLVEMDSNMDIVPDIAHRWEVLEGGRRYLFHLRDDVTWSDGTAVTAFDFKYAWMRLLEPETAAYNASQLYSLKNAQDYHKGLLEDPNLVGVRALDNLSLEVELEKPVNSFLYVLSSHIAFPVPRHVLQEYGDNWTDLDKLVSNGPFRLSRWKPGDFIELEADITYHKRFSGNLNQVKISFIGESAVDYLSLYRDDQVDILWLGLVEDFVTSRNRFPDDFRSSPFLMTYFIGFDTKLPPFDEPRVRRALALGLDRESLVYTLYQGRRYPSSGGFLPPGMLGYSEGIALPYDLSWARRELAEAGYPEGRELPAVEFLTGNDSIHFKFREIIQSQWEQGLGIDIQWTMLPWGEFLEHLDQEKPHLWTMGEYVDYPDPEAFGSILSQRTGWVHDEYEQLVNRAEDVQDHDQRLRLYQQADRIVVDQVPVLPFAYARYNVLVKPWVTRFPLSPTRGWFWKEVIIEEH